jgi:hypothetical protein
MRGVLGALLMVGLLVGCGGVEGGTEPPAAPADHGVGGVESFQKAPTSCFTQEGCGPNERCCLDGTNPMGYCALVCREMPE